MIVEWIVGVAVGLVTFLTGLMTGTEPAAWFVNLGDTINSFTSTLDGLGVWINFGVLGACLSAVMASWLVFSNVKLLRVGVSHIPQVGGGGS